MQPRRSARPFASRGRAGTRRKLRGHDQGGSASATRRRISVTVSSGSHCTTAPKMGPTPLSSGTTTASVMPGISRSAIATADRSTRRFSRVRIASSMRPVRRR